MATLLIVDDEVDVREFAANFFRRRKIQVLTASSGEEAINMVQEHKPNLVLLDIKMEGMDGIQALGQIKEKNKETKVIMVSGKKPDEEQSFERCRQLGAIDYIHKPLQLDELEKIVMRELN